MYLYYIYIKRQKKIYMDAIKYTKIWTEAFQAVAWLWKWKWNGINSDVYKICCSCLIVWINQHAFHFGFLFVCLFVRVIVGNALGNWFSVNYKRIYTHKVCLSHKILALTLTLPFGLHRLNSTIHSYTHTHLLWMLLAHVLYNI